MTSRERWQRFTTILFLIGSVLLGSLYIILPAQRFLRANPTATATAAIPVSGPTLAPTVTPSSSPPLPALHIHGTQVLDASDNPITLLGASRSSLEYACEGDGHFTVTDFANMRAWGMNVVRLPLSSEFWARTAACPHYQQYVAQAVRNAEQAGLYVIIDLQWDAPFDLPSDRTHGGAQCPLPDTHQDVAFWKSIAARYGSDPQVIFDLFGEPHDISWDTWYYGGWITSGCDVIRASGITTENGAYQAIGMQALAKAIRAIAPNNLLMVAGVNWGYDLSQAAAYPLGVTNVLYDTHPFNYAGKEPSDWTRAFGTLSAHAAVIAGEFGSYDCQTSYIASAIAYFNAHHMSWLAWNWGASGCGGPSLLAAWPATPSAPYGSYIKQQLALAAARNAARSRSGSCRVQPSICQTPS